MCNPGDDRRDLEAEARLMGEREGMTERRLGPPTKGSARIYALVGFGISLVGIAIGVVASPFVYNIRGVAKVDERTIQIQKAVDQILAWQTIEAERRAILEGLLATNIATATRNASEIEAMNDRLYYLEKEMDKGGRWTSEKQFDYASDVTREIAEIRVMLERLMSVLE